MSNCAPPQRHRMSCDYRWAAAAASRHACTLRTSDDSPPRPMPPSPSPRTRAQTKIPANSSSGGSAVRHHQACHSNCTGVPYQQRGGRRNTRRLRHGANPAWRHRGLREAFRRMSTCPRPQHAHTTQRACLPISDPPSLRRRTLPVRPPPGQSTFRAVSVT